MKAGLSLFLIAASASVAAAAETALPAPVENAITGALAVAGARVVATSYSASLPRGCQATSATVARPIEGSGRYAVKLQGSGCTGWAWVRLELWAPVPVTTRQVRQGEALAGAVTLVERQITSGRAPPVLAANAVAARSLARGQAVTGEQLRQGGSGAGEAVKVVVRSGGVEVATAGRMVGCGRGHTCAVLASGKHVEGQLAEGVLLVQAP
jgi:flagella basal body P-ring formation protein FlgA